MKLLGLVGYPLSHSFSQKYFTEKFKAMGLTDWQYELYPMPDIEKLKPLVRENVSLIGLNVTIPHKVSVLPLLDELDTTAERVGAVNTILIQREDGDILMKGYNTDVYGFMESLKPLLLPHDRCALVLGSGGASRAVCYGLEELGIGYKVVSRKAGQEQLSYAEVNAGLLSDYTVIINTTPLGMYPEGDTYPPLTYKVLTEKHLLYDLVYNPSMTQFLRQGAAAGARIQGGLQMLHLQAEKAWQIWSQPKP